MKVFRDPRSVAVVGASDNPAKWGHWLAKGALTGSDRRSLYFVNANATSVLGQPAYASLSDLPEVPELVVLTVPAKAAAGVAAEAAELGVQGLIGITAGVRFDRGQMRVLGPNCLGLYDSETALSLAWGTFTPGPLGIVSQSGQVGLEIAGLADAQGIGVSRFVSVGDQLDVTHDEVLDDLITHESTRLVVLYAEGFGAGRALIRTVARLTAAGKRTIVLAVGGSETSREAARSHTGALTSAMDVVDAACRAAGAIRVTTPAEAVNLAQLLLHMEPTGDRIAILTDSGGQGAIAADIATAYGLQPAAPIDLAGAGEQDLGIYSQVVAQLQDFDTILITGYFGCYGNETPSLAAREIEVIEALQGNVIVHTMASGGAAVDAMRRKGIPVYREIESALAAVSAGLRSARARNIPVASEVKGLPGSGYLAARSFLCMEGIPFPRCVEGVDVQDLQAPYVLKTDWIPHKSEHGAVVLGLSSQDEVNDAHAELVERLGHGRYVVEEMDVRPQAVEMIVGARRDPAFGPVVVVGAGGVLAELLQDTTAELAPVSHSLALAMLGRLKCLPLLKGWRGQSAVDIEGLADLIVKVSWVVASRPDIHELELNPVRVTADGPLAVDTLITGAPE
ncbi:acetate--CoA ligase family protein [Actinocrispum sp. NPDC049592]|uniref:acetate--CoA ligase family protein n=1 Tax=Actinocrispum sp. NPDC049592 TaxID=3154835 RepID=UPI00343C18F8